MYNYTFYDISVISEIELPELLETKIIGENPIYIKLGEVPQKLEGPDVITKVRNQTAPNHFLLNIKGIADYYAHHGKEIIINPAKEADNAVVSIFLLGSAMAAVLHQRGHYLLHASAVKKNGKVVLFAGNSGFGKSTTAAAFVKAGYHLLADDLSLIKKNGDKYFVLPAYPGLKLWTDVVEEFYFDEKVDLNQLTPVRNKKNKYKLGAEELVTDFDNEAAELAAIYFLKVSNNIPVFEPIQGFQAIKSLLFNAYRFGVLKGQQSEKSFFKVSSEIVAKIPLKIANRPTRFEDRDRFIKEVTEDAKLYTL